MIDFSFEDFTHSNIVVIGSINCDLTYSVKELPKKNQTILAQASQYSIGGKGANQAVAAAKAGANVSFLACVGNDAFGKKALEYLVSNQVDTSYIRTIANAPTGMASIVVTDQGENTIVVDSGANAFLTAADVTHIEALISQADVLIVQLELPLDIVRLALSISDKHSTLSILNPAPVIDGAKALLPFADIVTPNEIEIADLMGLKPLEFSETSLKDQMPEFARLLTSSGCQQAIITLGNKGCFVIDNNQFCLLPAFNVHAIDTTGAGDVFNGVLAVGLAEKLSLKNAAIRAAAAAAISTTKAMAEGAAPFRCEIDDFLAVNS